MVAIHDGRYPEGRSAVEEAAGLCARAGDRFFSIWSTLFLGEMITLEGKDEQAQNVLEQCLPTLRSLEMKAQEAEALRFLGLLALRQGSKDHAASLAAESVRLARETDDTQVVVWGLLTAARMEQARQSPQEAQALAEEGLRLALNRSDRLTVPAGLEQLGYVVATQDQPVWAARLFGTAQALREAMGEPLALIDQQEHKERITAVRARLDPLASRAACKQRRG